MFVFYSLQKAKFSLSTNYKILTIKKVLCNGCLKSTKFERDSCYYIQNALFAYILPKGIDQNKPKIVCFT